MLGADRDACLAYWRVLDRSQQMQLQTTGRRAGVDGFAEGHERDVETLELVWSLSKNGRHKDCCFASR